MVKEKIECFIINPEGEPIGNPLVRIGYLAGDIGQETTGIFEIESPLYGQESSIDRVVNMSPEEVMIIHMYLGRIILSDVDVISVYQTNADHMKNRDLYRVKFKAIING
jgi:hypothetical protein